MERKNLLDLEHKLNYYFSDKSLLKNALLHRSFGNENRRYKKISNERLELLGDAVLDLVVTEYLYKKYSDSNEGFLAKLKSMAISEPVLAKASKKMGVGEFLLLSKGEEVTGGRNRNSILGDAFEAILGAIYLDSNFHEAKKFVLYHLTDSIDTIEENEEIVDFKTVLQEYCQREYKAVPVYKVISEEGPDHKKVFEIQVSISEELYGIGKGGNKKSAEQLAAKNFFETIGVKVHEAL